jgi:hypothetical protein
VDVNYHVFIRELSTNTNHELKETHRMRYFFKPEIELIACQTGFNLLCFEEWLTGTTASSDTWGICYVLEAQ